ncbi:hypothetical protein CAPTEDRAFT_190114 [Capitella teleta]|uniref:G-protein coupled receptors family 1 profile domain-containing protein n=1 Tax=Capitella teleta TaxID=283909 RepID=R7UKY1_CAPTE|nr:hypothetical protein CAPTEDRAFT_190114 [Capitella teleta]|eukprot:ELU07194.1 hypothetical protein CAPTEDRAFT_190114 [Capitella teleta]
MKACWFILMLSIHIARPDTLDATTETMVQTIATATKHPFSKMSPAEMAKYLALKDAEFVVIQTLSCIAVFGNAVILAVIPRYANIGVPDVYMIALAVSDLCIGIFSSWKTLTWRYNKLSESMLTLSAHTYWLAFGLDAASSISASLFAMALSVDRCWALKFPLKHAQLWSVKKSKVFVAIVGLVSMSIGINYPLRFSVSLDNHGTGGLLISYPTTLGENKVLTIVSNYAEFVLRFAIPFVLMTVSNTWTLGAIWSSDRFRKKIDNSAKSALKAPRCLGITVGLVIIFFITQLLHAILLMDGMIFAYQHRGIFAMEAAFAFGNIFTKTNSVVNFFIYMAIGREFRRKNKEALVRIKEALSHSDLTIYLLHHANDYTCEKTLSVKHDCISVALEYKSNTM